MIFLVWIGLGGWGREGVDNNAWGFRIGGLMLFGVCAAVFVVVALGNDDFAGPRAVLGASDSRARRSE